MVNSKWALFLANLPKPVKVPCLPALDLRRQSGNHAGVMAKDVRPVHNADRRRNLPLTMPKQAVLAMENLKKTLEAAGCRMKDVVSATRRSGARS